MLVAVITGGFHSAAEYCWAKDSVRLEEEVYPVIYATSVGEYTCSVAMDKYSLLQSFIFCDKW